MTLDPIDGGWLVTTHQAVTYEVRLCPGLLDERSPHWLLRDDEEPPRRLVVVDAGVWHIHRYRLDFWLARLDAEYDVLVLAADEVTKTRAAVDMVIAKAAAMGLARRDELLAIGGGIILDIVGVAAAELRKGTPYVVVPTTLVGIIDAGIGAKRAVNHLGRKNYIGAYHAARLVLLDWTWLATLDKREIRAGLAEAKKVGEMVDPALLDLLEDHGPQIVATHGSYPATEELLRRSIDGLLTHLASDLFEQQLCRWPDYGHTISPALEMRTAGRLVHGEAVNVCSSLSAVLAARRGHVDWSYVERMIALSRALELPVYHDLLAEDGFLTQALASTVLTRGGHQNWPVPARTEAGHEAGHTFLQDVDAIPGELTAAAADLRKLAPR